MRLTVFQADKGDCLLLTGADGTRILSDGGMRASYSMHVAPALARLRESQEKKDGKEFKLDLVYVSHIDQDHISGVLQLMDDLVEWRVHDFQVKSGNSTHPVPGNLRPPTARGIWHNAFHEQVGGNAGAIEEMLAATAAVLEAGSAPKQRVEAAEHRELATSVSEALQLARRVGPEQLGIPVNEPFNGRLALVRDDQDTIELGALTITVIGPFEKELIDLRRDWNTWLRANQQELQRIRRRARADVDQLGTGEVERFREAIALQAHELGDRSRVTVPNLASLMLLVDEGKRTILLGGDGHGNDILRGLAHAGRLDERVGIHVDVLKVQHHGSENNLNADFCKRVTADHYVFCANGEHENPDLLVIDAIVDSRLGRARQLSRNPKASRPFKLWFNSSSAASTDPRGKRHMKKVERLVAARTRRSEGRMSSFFLEDRSSFDLALK